MKRAVSTGLALSLLASAGAAAPVGALPIAPPVPASAQPAAPRPGSYLLTPDVITAEDGRSVEVERGLLFVPENRRDPRSRIIAVHFVRFPALEPRASGEPRRAPVFLLPGGPGWDYDFTEPLMLDEVNRLRRTREVIAVAQRGYGGSPGLAPRLEARFPGFPPDKLLTAQARAARDRVALSETLQAWRARGVDLAGYDILNMVDDVHDLRAALGYERLVLRGCSFGSQWALAYMKRWPGAVDRALLSGVEPLDFNYDSPDGIWASMARVAAAAEADPDVAPHVPPGGIMRALQTVITRLEASPRTVTIRAPSGEGEMAVTVGADDVRLLIGSLSLGRRRSIENLGEWPRFVLEMHAGDYRFLAARAAEARAGARSESLILSTINHSLGISEARAAQLRAEPAARWLGDLNLHEHAVRSAAPTPQVDDAFRLDRPTPIPTLMLAGDYDWSTPIENAEHLQRFLPNGALVRVKGGRHCTETNWGELSVQRPEETAQVYSFIDADFARTPPRAVFARLPREVRLNPIDFSPPTGPSLYEQWLERRR